MSRDEWRAYADPPGGPPSPPADRISSYVRQIRWQIEREIPAQSPAGVAGCPDRVAMASLAQACSAVYLNALEQSHRQERPDRWKQGLAAEGLLCRRLGAIRRAAARQVLEAKDDDGILAVANAMLARPTASDPGWGRVALPAGCAAGVRQLLFDRRVAEDIVVHQIGAWLGGGGPAPSRVRPMVQYLRYLDQWINTPGPREYLVPGLFIHRIHAQGHVLDVLVTVFPVDGGGPTIEAYPQTPALDFEKSARLALDAVNQWRYKFRYKPLDLSRIGLAVAIGDYPGGTELPSCAGESLGLALVATLIADATQQPLPEHAAFTGRLADDPIGAIRPVDGVRLKAEAAARSGITRLFVPPLRFGAQSRTCCEEAEDGFRAAGVGGDWSVVEVGHVENFVGSFFGSAFEQYREQLKPVDPAPLSVGEITDLVTDRLRGPLLAGQPCLVLAPWWRDQQAVDPRLVRETVVAAIATNDDIWDQPLRPVVLPIDVFRAWRDPNRLANEILKQTRVALTQAIVQQQLSLRHFLLVADTGIDEIESEYQVQEIAAAAQQYPVLVVGRGSRWAGRTWSRHQQVLGAQDPGGRWYVDGDLLGRMATVWEPHLGHVLTPEAWKRTRWYEPGTVDEILPLQPPRGPTAGTAPGLAARDFFAGTPTRGQAYFIPRRLQRDAGGPSIGAQSAAPELRLGEWLTTCLPRDGYPPGLLLLGYGTWGKTTLLLKLVWDLVERGKGAGGAGPALMPLYVSLRQLLTQPDVRAEELFERLTADLLDDPGGPLNQVAWRQGGDLLLILDGLNEIPPEVAGNADSLLSRLGGLVRLVQQTVKADGGRLWCVVASRGADQVPGLPMNEVLGYLAGQRESTVVERFEAYRLLGLRPSEAQEFLRHRLAQQLSDQEIDDLWARAEKNPRLLESALYLHHLTTLDAGFVRAFIRDKTKILTEGLLVRQVYRQRRQDAILRLQKSGAQLESGLGNDDAGHALLERVAGALALEATRRGKLGLDDREIAAVLDRLLGGKESGFRSAGGSSGLSHTADPYTLLVKTHAEFAQRRQATKPGPTPARDYEKMVRGWFYEALVQDLARVGLVLRDTT